MNNRFVSSLKSIDYRLFSTLILMGLLPAIYTTVRIHFIGNLPSDWGFNIASQLSWVSLVYEVLQEGILLPVFFLIGQVLEDKAQVENRIRTGLVVTGCLYSIVAILLWIFLTPLTALMSQKPGLIPATVAYIRLETIASLLAVLTQFIIFVLITIKRESILLYLLGIQMALSILLDTCLVSSLPFSLNLGVNGIAVSNIIVNSIMLVASFVLLDRQGIRICGGSRMSFVWLKQWLHVGSFSGIESLVRNLAFMFMVVRMVNVVGEQGAFWTANSFIWTWLLLPVLQLGQLIKRDCGAGGMDAVRKNSGGYFVLTGVFVLVWVATIPLWKQFMQTVMNLENYRAVFHIVLISIGFYILFAFNNIIDSIFYGLGKTNYMLFQSVIINTLFYGLLFALYIAGIYKPTLDLIALMFALGIALDSILTFGMYIWMMRRKSGGNTVPAFGL